MNRIAYYIIAAIAIRKTRSFAGAKRRMTNTDWKYHVPVKAETTNARYARVRGSLH